MKHAAWAVGLLLGLPACGGHTDAGAGRSAAGAPQEAQAAAGGSAPAAGGGAAGVSTGGVGRGANAGAAGQAGTFHSNGGAAGGGMNALAGGAGEGAAVEVCKGPSTIEPVDPTTGACETARFLLACAGESPAYCASDSPSGCPEPPASGGAYSQCTNQCRPGEVGVACHNATLGRPVELPAECWYPLPIPGGSLVLACCPCDA